MKSLAAQLAHFLHKDTSRQNLKALARLLLVLAAMVAVYSVIFHLLMLREGREFSWFTGIYWTLTVMSTLGFGDMRNVPAGFGKSADSTRKTPQAGCFARVPVPRVA